jgi:SAM-dependent methyltransferase
MIAEMKRVYRALGFIGAPQGTLRYRVDQAARSAARAWQSRTRNRTLSRSTASAPTMAFDPRDLGSRDMKDSGWFRRDLREICPGFRIDPRDVVIDVGCGEGGMAQFCANFCDHVIIADVNPTRVATAEKRLKNQPARTVTALVTDANPLPVESETATKVISCQVMEHVDDPVQFLGELVRVGKPGATYFLSVPDPAAEYVQKRVAPDSSFQKPNHIRILERDAFERLVSGAGLVVHSHLYYGFFWAMYHALVWPCNVDFDAPCHPVLDAWCAVWNGLLDLPRGRETKEALEAVMPKDQVIIARKPS